MVKEAKRASALQGEKLRDLSRNPLRVNGTDTVRCWGSKIERGRE